MNLDPFGHIAAAKHFQSAARREFANAKNNIAKQIWKEIIDNIEYNVKKMEENEINYWASFDLRQT